MFEHRNIGFDEIAFKNDKVTDDKNEWYVNECTFECREEQAVEIEKSNDNPVNKNENETHN